MSDLDRLRDEYIDHIKCGRLEEAARTLAARDELLLVELASPSALASLFGVGPSTISNWIERHDDFPSPRTGSGRTARYARSEVIAWWAQRHPALADALKRSEP